VFKKGNIENIEEIRKKQKKLSYQAGNTVISSENGKYGPIEGGIDHRTYQSLTGSN
jgi:hypothetical protein